MVRLAPLMLFLLSCLLTYSSCKRDEIEIPQERSFPLVDQRLWPFFEAFEEEAALRGIQVDLVAEAITGEIMEIDEEHVAGLCRYSPIVPGEITVDKEFWEASSANFREFIIFHELGHCYLDRDHREDKDASGFCISLMRSGIEDCRDHYNVQTRAVYIDELFFPEEF